MSPAGNLWHSACSPVYRVTEVKGNGEQGTFPSIAKTLISLNSVGSESPIRQSVAKGFATHKRRSDNANAV